MKLNLPEWMNKWIEEQRKIEQQQQQFSPLKKQLENKAQPARIDKEIWGTKKDKKIKLTLPEWEEDDRLDGEELDDGIEGSEQVLGRHVEHQQGKQRDRNAEIYSYEFNLNLRFVWNSTSRKWVERKK